MAIQKGHLGRWDFVVVEPRFPIILFNKEKNGKTAQKKTSWVGSQGCRQGHWFRWSRAGQGSMEHKEAFLWRSAPRTNWQALNCLKCVLISYMHFYLCRSSNPAHISPKFCLCPGSSHLSRLSQIKVSANHLLQPQNECFLCLTTSVVDGHANTKTLPSLSI